MTELRFDGNRIVVSEQVTVFGEQQEVTETIEDPDRWDIEMQADSPISFSDLFSKNPTGDGYLLLLDDVTVSDLSLSVQYEDNLSETDGNIDSLPEDDLADNETERNGATMSDTGADLDQFPKELSSESEKQYPSELPQSSVEQSVDEATDQSEGQVDDPVHTTDTVEMEMDSTPDPSDGTDIAIDVQATDSDGVEEQGTDESTDTTESATTTDSRSAWIDREDFDAVEAPADAVIDEQGNTEVRSPPPYDSVDQLSEPPSPPEVPTEEIVQERGQSYRDPCNRLKRPLSDDVTKSQLVRSIIYTAGELTMEQLSESIGNLGYANSEKSIRSLQSLILLRNEFDEVEVRSTSGVQHFIWTGEEAYPSDT